MAASSAINVKVFLRDNNSSDARRFTVDASAMTSFIYIKEKLQMVFPVLRDSIFKITWKDSDGDDITIADDEDLVTALTEMSSNVKTLYVTITQRNHEPVFLVDAELQDIPYRGPRVICDICNQSITGLRYKCLQCPDYDLCTDCEHVGHHSEHLMIRVPNNDVYMPKCARKFMHHVARTMKKSAHTATKEAYRAAKFASKFGPAGKPCEGNKDEQAQSQPQAGASNQAPEEPQGCPFGTSEAFNMNDVHALGAMARQHLGPLLDVLQTAPEQTAAGNTEQGGLFLDLIRNAVDGFFGRIPENPEQQQGHQSEKPTEKEPSAQNTTNEENHATPKNSATGMDVDSNTTGEEARVAVASDTNVSSQKPENFQRRDPGWTFVATNPSEPDQSAAANQNSQSSPPTLVYHDNPVIAEGLVKLHEMGFSNESGVLTHLLEHYKGNVAAVVKALVENLK